MNPFIEGLIIGFIIAGGFRILVGRFTIWTSRRGFVWKWETTDEAIYREYESLIKDEP